MAYHGNLRDVKEAIQNLRDNLHAIQVSSTQCTNSAIIGLRDCQDILQGIVYSLQSIVVPDALNTAKFTHNNLLSRVIQNGPSVEEKLLMLRHFLGPNPSRMRATHQAVIGDTWQKANALKTLIENFRVELDNLGHNSTAILNRFATMLNGIGWFNGIFYPKIHAYVRRWYDRVENNTLDEQTIEQDATWLTNVIQQLEAF